MGCANSNIIKTPCPKSKNEDQSLDSDRILSDRQIWLIKKSWRKLADDMTGVGTKIFLRIFQLNPKIKQLFPFNNIEGEELLKNHSFKSHASRFMQAVDAAVNNINNWNSFFTPLLHGLGRQHAHIIGFKPEFLEAFSDAIMFVFEAELGDKFNNDIKQSWRIVFMYIMSKLQEGYSDDAQQISHELEQEKNRI